MSLKNIIILFPVVLSLILGLIFFSMGNSVGMIFFGFAMLFNFSYWSHRYQLNKYEEKETQIHPNAVNVYIGTEKDLRISYPGDIPNGLSDNLRTSKETRKRKIWQPNFTQYFAFYVLEIDNKNFPAVTKILNPTIQKITKISETCARNGVPVILASPKYKIILIQYSGLVILVLTLLVLLTPFYTPWLFTPFSDF